MPVRSQNRTKQTAIWEWLLFQLCVAVSIGIDLIAAGRLQYSFLILPVLITFWSSLRMQWLGMTRWLNPFVIGIASTSLSVLIYTVSDEIWQPRFVTELAFRGLGGVIMDRIVLSVASGAFLGFVCTIGSSHLHDLLANEDQVE